MNARSHSVKQLTRQLIPITAISIFASTLSAAPPEYHNVVVADAPILSYRFNEASGPAINHGTLGATLNAAYFGTPQRDVATGSGDSGVSFDSSDDYLESLSSAPGALGGNPTFTAEAVFLMPPSGSAILWPPFLHWGVSDGTPEENTMKSVYFSFSRNDSNRLFVGFYNGGLRTAAPINLGIWHHVVWVRQGGNTANTGSILYLDGVAVPLEDDPFLPSNSSIPAVVATPFRINRARDFNRYFTGILDEIALYDRALSPTEVQEHLATFGTPQLVLTRTSGSAAELSWQPLVPGFFLQESPTLAPGSWQLSSLGFINPSPFTIAPGSRFFRLFRP